MRAIGLKLERFKIVSGADLHLAPITLLIGGNNAGKSTVLQALALLAQSVGGRQLQTGGPYVDLGGTPAALLNRSSRVGEGWSIEVTWEDQADQRVEVSFLCRSTTEAPFVASEGIVRLDVAGGLTVRAWDSTVGPRVEVDGPQLAEAMGPAELRSDQRFGHLPTPARASAVPPEPPGKVTELLPTYARSVAAPYLYDEFSPRPGIARALGSYRYVGPDRHFTHAAYELSESIPAVPLHQQDLANALAYDREARRAVDRRCREIFGFGVSADFAQGRNVDLVATSDDGAAYSLNHMGSGFGQVVWIAVYLELQRRAAQNDGNVPLVGIEEAELHLHPAAQPRVAGMLASYAKAGVQLILTTQSEHLLIALLQLVTTGELDAADLAVYHMGGGDAERLAVDERGRLSGGLKGFFEANEEELLAHLEALIHGGDQSRSTRGWPRHWAGRTSRSGMVSRSST